MFLRRRRFLLALAMSPVYGVVIFGSLSLFRSNFKILPSTQRFA
ncbi:hypothetical protein CAMGR0001_1771 [Campylobacter gracilis RM3268]|uniref:Uncharacterized protein n=1 Tax=Campylobacter gracilis RM3268 TaxID=553220 RepID=C8PK66_9BACT|nr:hypothetical protein CAMGR0001_1771 [Campylobacter gracilis RM3268]